MIWIESDRSDTKKTKYCLPHMPKRKNTTKELPTMRKVHKTHQVSDASSSAHPPPSDSKSREIDSKAMEKLLSFLILGLAKSRVQNIPRGFTPTDRERDTIFLEVFFEMNDSDQNYKAFTDAMQQPLKRVEFPEMLPVLEQSDASERNESFHELIEEAKKSPHIFPDVDLNKIDAVIEEKQRIANLNDYMSEDDGMFDDDDEDEPEEEQHWRTFGIEIHRIEIGTFHSNPNYFGQYRLKIDAITKQLVIYCFEFSVNDLKDEDVADINTLQKYRQFVIDCTNRFRQSRIFKMVCNLNDLEAVHFHPRGDKSVLHLQWKNFPKFYEKKVVLDDYVEISDFTMYQQASTHKRHTLVLKQDINTDYLVGMMYCCVKDKPDIANLIKHGTALSKFPSHFQYFPASTEAADESSSEK